MQIKGEQLIDVEGEYESVEDFEAKHENSRICSIDGVQVLCYCYECNKPLLNHNNETYYDDVMYLCKECDEKHYSGLIANKTVI